MGIRVLRLKSVGGCLIILYVAKIPKVHAKIVNMVNSHHPIFLLSMKRSEAARNAKAYIINRIKENKSAIFSMSAGTSVS